MRVDTKVQAEVRARAVLWAEELFGANAAHTFNVVQDNSIPVALPLHLGAYGSANSKSGGTATRVNVSIFGAFDVQDMDLCPKSMGVHEPTNV